MSTTLAPVVARAILRGRTVLAVGLWVLIAGCSSTRHQAPVEQRGPGVRSAPGASTPSAAPVPAVVRPVEAVRPSAVAGVGTYTVKPGDTLQRIANEAGQNWRDIVRWNGLTNPNALEVGQVLRVQAPPGETAVARTPPATSVAAAPASTPTPSASGRDADEAVDWAWPTTGKVHAGFDESKQKGIVILGKAGDAVLASADGRVVYAGAGLRGYGNLLIVKHNNTYLSAYAHNQALLVKEDQAVKRGQKIAEMGSTDADRVQLHFEIRRQGKPIDPTGLLPPR